ncbi:MAG: protein jag [Lachnospiraceae bacterium]|nr:protein jag [Lachnospiraceae bacterium]
MEDYIKVSAKTVEDAIIEASIQLGTSSDNIEYHVLEKETRGFLGIGAKKALIEARKKVEAEEDIIGEVFRGKKPVKNDSVKPQKEEKKPEKEYKKPEKEFKKQDKEFKKPDKEAKKEFRKESGKESNPEVKKETKPESKNDFKSEVKPAAKPVEADNSDFDMEDMDSRVPKAPLNPEEAESKAEEFLKNVFATMDMKVVIKAECQDDTLNIDLSGEDMGILIGKRGQTLDSLQYLVSLVVNKGKSSYVRVKLDTENYRNRRKTTLENLAKNIAFKVKKTRRPVYLEPMNPYERRIIHSALQNDPYVTTHSEGEEPCRKVVVTLKKRERSSYQGRDYRRSDMRSDVRNREGENSESGIREAEKNVEIKEAE